ncbi:TonB-dependent receptor [Paremcibacter congregatus]|uniref:TonB-dependent receptor n=2 Tax=Paremcibacter congregatus TaxID=2043170 RepID=A0A2G4YWG5_9PROT|nr:TonB-dependent receptor [Paremcibacter congregatus]QDE26394.1 TonB-dependent receptor [Paremcibacter congregatus]
MMKCKTLKIREETMNSYNSKRFSGYTTLFMTTALCVGGLGLSAPASAQMMLEEITVTAQKREQGINDVGITVNAFSGEIMKERGISTSEDIAQITPGLTVNETAATGVPLYTIRGIGFQDYSTAASSTVGLYFDEVSMPYSVMSRGLVFDLERVEVLKGPQGDLYGRNTTAGQINFISKKPTAETGAGITVGFSSFETLDVEGYLNGQVAEGVNARLAFKTTQSGKGWQKSLTRDDTLGKKNIYSLRGLVNFELSETVNLLLNVHYSNDQSENKANTVYDGRLIGLDEFSAPYKQLFPYAVSGETPPWYSTGDNRAADWTNSYTDASGTVFNLRPKRDNQLKGTSVKLDWDITEEISLTSVTGYDKFDRVESNDWDGMAANDSGNINTTDLEVFSSELRVTGQTDKMLWIVGAYYSEDKMDELYNYFMSDSVYGNGSIAFGISPFQFAPILQLHTRYNQKTDSQAAFAHVEYNVTDKLRVTLAARYTEEDRSWSGCTFDAGDGSLAGFSNFAFGATLSPGACSTIDDDPASPTYVFGVIGSPNINDAFHVYEETIETNKWMFKVGLDYALDDDLLLYATFSNGFKSGGFNGANSNTTQQLKSYGAEEVNSYEVGIKSTLLEGAMQLNLSGFYYDYKNKQEQDLAVTFVGNISGLTNVPKSRIYGAELDMQWAPAEGWFVSFGAAYLNSKILEWEATSNDSSWPTVVTFDASGRELAMTPKWQLNAGIDYEWEISSGLMMKIGGDVNYQDKTTGGAQLEDATSAYTVANLRATLSRDNWQVMVWSRNLFNEYYYPAAYTGGNGPYVRSVGMPRTFGITLSYDF